MSLKEIKIKIYIAQSKVKSKEGTLYTKQEKSNLLRSDIELWLLKLRGYISVVVVVWSVAVCQSNVGS